MSRFNLNRHGTLIIALVLSTMCLPPAARTSFADPSMGAPGDQQGGGDTGMGDPDVPDGAGRSKIVKSGVLARGPMTTRVHAVGDGMNLRARTMLRLYVAWVGYRGFWLHF